MNGFSLEDVILRRVVASDSLEKKFQAVQAEEAEGVRKLAMANSKLEADRIKVETDRINREAKFEADEREADAVAKRKEREAEMNEKRLRLEMEVRVHVLWLDDQNIFDCH